MSSLLTSSELQAIAKLIDAIDETDISVCPVEVKDINGNVLGRVVCNVEHDDCELNIYFEPKETKKGQDNE